MLYNDCDGNKKLLTVYSDGVLFGFITEFDGDVNKYAFYLKGFAFKDAKPTLWEMVREIETRGMKIQSLSPENS